MSAKATTLNPLSRRLTRPAPAKSWWKICVKNFLPVTYFRRDRKSTRLNSSHLVISYAVFCLKKKNKQSILAVCNTSDELEAGQSSCRRRFDSANCASQSRRMSVHTTTHTPWFAYHPCYRYLE